MRAPLLLLPVLFAVVSCQTTPPAQPDRFTQMDVNQDGVLDRGEINDFYTTELFKGRDTNGDGKITKEEWNPQITAEDARKFALIDTNKDGVVTLEEAKAYARRQGIYTSTFAEADTNKDGRITREEARAYFASVEGPAR
jgi:Ca2+-binding EF-hand superfamily protein